MGKYVTNILSSASALHLKLVIVFSTEVGTQPGLVQDLFPPPKYSRACVEWKLSLVLAKWSGLLQGTRNDVHI